MEGHVAIYVVVAFQTLVQLLLIQKLVEFEFLDYQHSKKAKFKDRYQFFAPTQEVSGRIEMLGQARC